MFRPALTLCLILLSSLSMAQNRSNVWVFGRGNVMDFNTDPVSFSTTTWAPATNPNKDLNNASTWCDRNGNLQLYFLNGKYYDASGSSIPGGQVPAYYNYFEGAFNYQGASFVPSYLSDTLFHYYVYQLSTNTLVRRIKLNALYWNGSTWTITPVQDYNGGSNLGLNMEHPIVINDDIGQMNMLIISEETSNNNGNHRPLRITATGFKVLPASVLTTLFDTQLEEVHINFGAVYNSLFNRFYSYHTGQHIRKNRYIQSWTNLGYGFFVKNTEKFPLVIPGRNDSTALERIRIYGETTSLDGRYLFYLAMINGEYWLRLFRYDLTSPDSASFAQNAVEISFGTRILLNNTTDIQMAPDGNIYYPILEERVFNHPNNCKIGRIVNAGDPDTANITAEPNFATLAPFSVYYSFPYFSANQALPRPFTLTADCSDSVQFKLAYKNVPDSVWWNFGDTALGPLNHSTDLEPTVRYSSFGPLYVTVELWLRGVLLKTLGDTVTVKPSPRIQLPKDTLLCRGESRILNAHQGFNANYLWSTGSTDSLITANESGTYWVQVSNSCGTVQDTFRLTVLDPPTATLRDTALCEEWTYVLRVHADSASYLWNTGDTVPYFTPNRSGTYSVEITNPCGQIQDQAHVEIRPCLCNVWIPNSFSPNGDGVNETFEIKADCPEFAFTLDIYNRWGEHVHHQTDLQNPWTGTHQGKTLPAGVYTYRIQYEGRDQQGLQWVEKNGTVQLMQ
jgi:gliding motility-associated-like protein